MTYIVALVFQLPVLLLQIQLMRKMEEGLYNCTVVHQWRIRPMNSELATDAWRGGGTIHLGGMPKYETILIYLVGIKMP